MTFSHQLAKVRVRLDGEMKDSVNEIKILTYPSCTVSKDGTVAGTGEEGYVKMRKVIYGGKTYFEACVVPNQAITQIDVDGIQGQLSGSGLTPLVGKINTINLTVNEAGPKTKP